MLVCRLVRALQLSNHTLVSIASGVGKMPRNLQAKRGSSLGEGWMIPISEDSIININQKERLGMSTNEMDRPNYRFLK